MDIIKMLERAVSVMSSSPADLEGLKPGQVKQFGYASFIVAKSGAIRSNLTKYQNAIKDRADANKAHGLARDAMTKAVTFQAWKSAKRRSNAVDRLAVIAGKLS